MKPPKDLSITKVPAEGTSIPPLEWDTKDIEVLCIPADGSNFFKMTMNTKEIDHAPSLDRKVKNETQISEEWVKHVPDISRSRRARNFDWESRSLVIANINCAEYPEYAQGWWCMYKCNEQRGGSLSEGLERNPSFKHEPVLGDVYVFRLDCTTPDNSRRLRYAKNWRIPDRKHAREILDLLALCDSEKGRQ